ncbi:hypothetical protein HJC23_000759 [Cyclotella cryptica]|uniref:Fucoxanthin chlorophyll a/c binding protein n=1 Tax=Cyclotella cryptica TaxID=29204 RepID=A0ABD3PZI4_9STRA|eukprot:CCRYP_010128-RB/>CCRYP_010128-RB protein AED:0.04 eAED:0.04 QI:945/1/1/1/0.5/0.33/3/386/231
MKFSTLALFSSGVAAFAPPMRSPKHSLLAIHAFVPNNSEFCFGLPGKVAPFSDGFDPLGFCDRESYETMKTFRESEVTHGRVAMLAVVGFLVTEQPLEFHPLFNIGSKDIGPAIRHLDEVRAVAPVFFEILAVAIGASELRRALIGWEVGTGKNLQDNYYPGDIGFDPFGLKPQSAQEFDTMATKELNNGRLAMLAAIGFIAQELVNGKEIFVNLGVAPDTFDSSSLPIQF